MKYLNIPAIFATLLLFVTICTASAIFYLAVVDRPYLSYPTLPITVVKKTVFPGDVLPLKVTRCNRSKERKIHTSSRLLENLGDDQEVMVLEIIGVVAAPGCITSVSMIHRIPEATRPGKYRIQGVSTVQGLIRNFTVTWYSEPFTVAPRVPKP